MVMKILILDDMGVNKHPLQTPAALEEQLAVSDQQSHKAADTRGILDRRNPFR